MSDFKIDILSQKLLSLPEVAKLLGVDNTTIRSWARPAEQRGKYKARPAIPTTRIGTRIRTSAEALDWWNQKCTNPDSRPRVQKRTAPIRKPDPKADTKTRLQQEGL